GPSPQPPGEIIDMGTHQMHIHRTGEKNHKPTLVLETGQALPTEHYHWLSEGLKDSLRVFRYDRAGIGYSELSHTPRDPETIARELHELLEVAGEKPPYIMAGHSFGGLYIRVFTQLYPDEVDAMVFIDASHPDQRERFNRPDPKDVSWMLSGMALLADAGVMALFDRLNGSILYVDELPKEVNERFYDYTLNGTYYRGFREENRWDKSAYQQARTTKDFGDLPIRVFSAGQRYDGTKAKPLWLELQREIAGLSTNGKQVTVAGHHNSIYTTKENADLICAEILRLAKQRVK
ncbi:MAG: alpha/beta hydrolase, partial [Bacteroidota bacterium]